MGSILPLPNHPLGPGYFLIAKEGTYDALGKALRTLFALVTFIKPSKTVERSPSSLRPFIKAHAKGRTMTAPIKRYYAVADLAVDDFDVIVLTPGGQKLVARRTAIWRRRQVTTIWRARVERREPGRATRFDYRDLPTHFAAALTRWRPIDPAAFVARFGPLPAPARIEGDVAWQTPPEPPAPPEQQDELEWPHEYAEAPKISLREVEIRILRALRTDRAAGERGVDVRPAGFRDSVAVLAQNHPADEFVDPNFIAPAGEAWRPTRRDRSDYLASMGVFVKMTAAERSVILLRSLNPPYSFRAIGQRIGKSAEAARRRYRKALETAWRIANGTGRHDRRAARPDIDRSRPAATDAQTSQDE